VTHLKERDRQQHCLAVCKELLRNGASIDKMNSDGKTVVQVVEAEKALPELLILFFV